MSGFSKSPIGSVKRVRGVRSAARERAVTVLRRGGAQPRGIARAARARRGTRLALCARMASMRSRVAALAVALSARRGDWPSPRRSAGCRSRRPPASTARPRRSRSIRARAGSPSAASAAWRWGAPGAPLERVLARGPVHDLVFERDGALLAATEVGLFRIEAADRVSVERVGTGDAARQVRALAVSGDAVVAATDAGVFERIAREPSVWRRVPGLPFGEARRAAIVAPRGRQARGLGRDRRRALDRERRAGRTARDAAGRRAGRGGSDRSREQRRRAICSWCCAARSRCAVPPARGASSRSCCRRARCRCGSPRTRAGSGSRPTPGLLRGARARGSVAARGRAGRAAPRSPRSRARAIGSWWPRRRDCCDARRCRQVSRSEPKASEDHQDAASRDCARAPRPPVRAPRAIRRSPRCSAARFATCRSIRAACGELWDAAGRRAWAPEVIVRGDYGEDNDRARSWDEAFISGDTHSLFDRDRSTRGRLCGVARRSRGISATPCSISTGSTSRARRAS